ncbi:DUF4124 domain-containing protein [Pseudomonas sp. RIT-PI-AD]|uniref:DUF4124 domain-containing protein n=1 Tax=Pseudomonas sp. RIT-PI-AD TaxID=3035294 RepID=UPI0021D91B8D|nr:DUF4124 domain-containing protein [Pseudomonas sp. RIT-PI-AD]
MARQDGIRLTLLLCLCSPLLAGAADLYRYVNDKGVTVLDRQGVPPEFISKGYQVLNDQGRVIQVVPPAPSREEMQRRLDAKARAGSDVQLMRLYSSVEDVDRALKRKLSEIDGLISVVRGNLQSVKVQQDNLQGRAADLERAGRAVPADLVAQINDLKAEQQRLEKDIQRYQDTREQTQVSFSADRDRLAQLLGRGN